MNPEKEYNVSVPIAGFITISVNANDKEDARNKASSVEWRIDLKVPENQKIGSVQLSELDAYEKMMTGNTFHYPLSEISIDQVNLSKYKLEWVHEYATLFKQRTGSEWALCLELAESAFEDCEGDETPKDCVDDELSNWAANSE